MTSVNNQTQPEMPIPIDTLLLIGPVLYFQFIGSIFSWCLFGISIVQLLSTVYIIFVLDVFQSVVVATSGWHTLCTGWGHPSVLQFPGWTFIALPCVSGIDVLVAAWVQIFFSWRIYSLGNWHVIPVLIIILALAQCAAAWAIGIGFIALQDIALLHKANMFARTIIWLGGAALADVLYSAKRNITIKQTERIITHLIHLTVETGAVTATSAILELILFQTFQMLSCYAKNSDISSSNQAASTTVIQLQRTMEVMKDTPKATAGHDIELTRMDKVIQC
ncbi:hypothetical protein EV360DRAFT_72951 [Lentinula raphanica]|nr:hypothetical protein EV360DRAFT_72951 [Lentinula raphanica]